MPLYVKMLSFLFFCQGLMLAELEPESPRKGESKLQTNRKCSFIHKKCLIPMSLYSYVSYQKFHLSSHWNISRHNQRSESSEKVNFQRIQIVESRVQLWPIMFVLFVQQKLLYRLFEGLFDYLFIYWLTFDVVRDIHTGKMICIYGHFSTQTMIVEPTDLQTHVITYNCFLTAGLRPAAPNFR